MRSCWAVMTGFRHGQSKAPSPKCEAHPSVALYFVSSFYLFTSPLRALLFRHFSAQDGSSRINSLQLAREELELYVPFTGAPVAPLLGCGPISSFGTSLNASLRHGQDGTEERSSSDTTVSAPELLRLKKRFMKLDKDGSGTIDRDEFLQIPQIANNPLAHRMIAIFDEE